MLILPLLPLNFNLSCVCETEAICEQRHYEWKRPAEKRRPSEGEEEVRGGGRGVYREVLADLLQPTAELARRGGGWQRRRQ